MLPLKTKSFSIPGRALRIGLGAVLLAVFGYAMLPGVFYAQAPAGRVNADLITLRAPIDGQVSFTDLRIGERVTRGQALAVLRDAPDRDVRLANLQAQTEALSDRIANLSQQVAALEPFLQRLGGDSQNFRSAVVATLTAQVAEAEARLRSAEANARLQEAQFKRIAPLAEKGFASSADLDRRRSELDVAQAEAAAQRKNLDRLRQERNAADQGIYLTDSYNNAPYSQQRRDEIELQRLSLLSRRAELEAERQQTERQLQAEQRRRQQVGEATLVAPADGLVWRLLESENATIGISAPLVQIADCSRIFFEVARDRRTESTLSIGDAAQVEFERNGRMVAHKARLVGLRGDQDGDRREFAIAAAPGNDQIRWIFAVDFASGIRTDTQTAITQPESCPVGRVGRLYVNETLVDRIARRFGNLFSAA